MKWKHHFTCLPLPSFVDKSPSASNKRAAPPASSWWTLYFEANKLFSHPRFPQWWSLLLLLLLLLLPLSFSVLGSAGLAPWTVMHVSWSRRAGSSPCVVVCRMCVLGPVGKYSEVPGFALMTTEQTYSNRHTGNDRSVTLMHSYGNTPCFTFTDLEVMQLWAFAATNILLQVQIS